MTGLVDWAASRARMVIAFILMSLIAGGAAYFSLPKEGEPDIEIPALFVSVPFPGISAEDSEKLLVKPMETELSDLDGLKTMSGTASEGYAGVALEFEFGWDKTKIMADVRDAMSNAEAQFPAGADQYSINEINFSEFPIIIVNLTGQVPERTLLRVAKDLQDRLEGLEPVLEAALTGHRDEMVEVIIDPLRLEAYNVTAGELINVVVNNNQLIAAGEVETETGAFAVKIPSSFDDQRDIYNLPVKVDGDRVVTLGELALIRLTFEDRSGTARFNGENTVALQVVKRKGFNIIDTANLVKAEVEAEKATWEPELREAIAVGTSNDQSRVVGSMVSQLEGSVLTAIALVMIVVLAALGARSALLVGFAIPTSFLLCFVLLAVMGITISNIVMFGLILAVGMLVDGAIVVVEYADKRIQEGAGPMHAYVEAAKRMFWPIVSSTATTLCAFLPMLFWPGVPGQFMGMLPVTLIFVLSSSLVVALIYLPVMGGVAGRMSRTFERSSAALVRVAPWWLRVLLVPPSLYLMFLAAMQVLNPAYLLGPGAGMGGMIFGALLFVGAAMLSSITLGAAKVERSKKKIDAGYRRSPFGRFISLIADNKFVEAAIQEHPQVAKTFLARQHRPGRKGRYRAAGRERHSRHARYPERLRFRRRRRAERQHRRRRRTQRCHRTGPDRTDPLGRPPGLRRRAWTGYRNARRRSGSGKPPGAAGSHTWHPHRDPEPRPGSRLGQAGASAAENRRLGPASGNDGAGARQVRRNGRSGRRRRQPPPARHRLADRRRRGKSRALWR